MAPEPRQDRMLGVAARRHVRAATARGRATPASSSSTSTPATCRASSGCRSSRASRPSHSTSTASKIASTLKRTDAEFWRIFDFTFLEGGPYGTRRRRRRAVRRGDQRARRASAVLRRPAGASARRSRPTASASASSASSRTCPEHALRALRRHLGAAHDGEDRRLQAGDHGRLPRHGAGAATRRRCAGHPRGVQLAAAPRRAARPKDYKAIVAPVRDQVRGVRPRDAARPIARSPESQVLEADRCCSPSSALLFVTAPDGQPRQHQHQPHHGAGLRDRRAQGVRRAGAHAGRAVPGREHAADAARRRWSASSCRSLVLRAIEPERLHRLRALHPQPARLRLRRGCWRSSSASISGVYPAWRMSRLHPVEALKGGPSR